MFAQIVGTLQLLRPVERPLIRGLLINRFRGRRELFDEGRRWLEANTGVPVVGVMPWLDELFPPEDSLDLLERRGRKRSAELDIVVLKLPSLSNFSDLDPLEAEPTVQLRWVSPGESLGTPDAVVIPGSKQTLRDLTSLRRTGLDAQLVDFAMQGGEVFGICGGMQMMGESLQDPDGLEGEPHTDTPSEHVPGLALLPIRTVFGGGKALRQRHSTALWPAQMPPLRLEGFELHRGLTEVSGDCTPLCADDGLGWIKHHNNQAGAAAGTYLHGIFDNGPWRRRWLNRLRRRRDLAELNEDQPHHSRQREALLDRLADAFEQHVNLDPLLLSLLERQAPTGGDSLAERPSQRLLQRGRLAAGGATGGHAHPHRLPGWQLRCLRNRSERDRGEVLHQHRACASIRPAEGGVSHRPLLVSTFSTSRPRSLLWWSLRALLAGAAGGAMAAVVVSLALTLQQWIWGASVLQGLPGERPLVWCLLWAGGIGLLLSLLQRQRQARGLPEMKETLAQLRAPEGLNTKNGFTQLLGGILALTGGGTLGPEALMTRLVAVGSHHVWKGADRNLVAAAMAGSLGLFHSPWWEAPPWRGRNGS